MRFNFRKIASVLASVVMIGSTAGIAAAATNYYPTPFTGGDVAIVYTSGSHAGAASDFAAAVKIQSDLSSKAATTTTPSGKYVQIKGTNDEINLGDYASNVLVSSLTKDDLPTLLADGTYRDTNNNAKSYTQEISLGRIQLTHFADSDYKDKEPTIGFRIASGSHVLNYSLEFTSDPDFTSAALETTDIEMMGKTYYISDVVANGLTLLDSGTTAMVTEGETSTVKLGDKSYSVSIEYISSDSVKLTVNGELTSTLKTTTEPYQLDDGTYVGVKSIMYDSKSGTLSKAEISLGSGKLELVDGETVALNGEDVSGLTAYVDNSSGKLDSITISWDVDDDSFVTTNSSLSMPGFDSIKLSMKSLVVPTEETTKINYDGDSAIELQTPIKDGTAKFDIIYTNGTSGFSNIGKETGEYLKTSNTNALTFNVTDNTDEYFVASWNSSRDAESYLLSATVTTKDNLNVTTFKNAITGESVCSDVREDHTCKVGGNVVLTVDKVYKSGSDKWVNFTINSGGSFDKIYTAEGMEIDLPWRNYTEYNRTISGSQSCPTLDTSNNQLNVVRIYNETSGMDKTCYPTSYVLNFDEENKDGDLGAGNSFNVTLSTTGTDYKVTVSDIDTGSSEYEIGDTNVMESYVQSDLATKVLYDTSGTQDTADIVYHGGQVYAELYLASQSTSINGKVTIAAPVKDTEIDSVKDKNLIVVGGSCINTVARKIIDPTATEPICGADFTSKTGVGAGHYLIESVNSPYTTGKIAVLVAGYEAADTTNAVDKLLEGTVSTDVGTNEVLPKATA